MRELNDDTHPTLSEDTAIDTGLAEALKVLGPNAEAIRAEMDRIYAEKPWPPPNENVAIWIDRDIVEHYQARGMEDWRERLNDTLRQAMRAEQDNDAKP